MSDVEHGNGRQVEWRALKWFCKKLTGSGLNVSSRDYVSDGLRLLRTTDIDEDGTLNASIDPVYINHAEVINKFYELQNGDLLLGIVGSPGRCLLYESSYGSATFNGNLVRFRPSSKVDSRYIKYCIQSKTSQEEILANRTTTAVPLFTGSQYSGLRLPWCRPEQQKAIADYLDTKTTQIDALIKAKRRLIESLKEYRQALISEVVTSGNVGSGTHTSKVEWRALKWFCKNLGVSGINFSASEYISDGFRLLRTTDVAEDGCLNVDIDAVYIDPAWVRNRRHLLIEGDLLFSSRGTLGRCFLYHSSYGPAVHLGNLIKFQPGPETDSRYIKYCAQSSFFKNSIAATAGTTAIPQFTAKQFANLKLPWHEPIQQRAIADYLDTETAQIDKVVTLIKESIDLLAERRQALITAAVTGELPVSEAAV